MDRFQAMQVFTAVVDASSFTRAADKMNLPRTTVTTVIQSLESLLQVRLLNRTTRRISLTPDGAAYYERCVRILADVDETEASLRNAASVPRGRLRIDVKPSIGRMILLPNLCDFYTKYPEVELVLGMSDRAVDMVQEAVDCVIRVGELEDSSLVARRIGTFQGVTCASPDYLANHGIPQAIEDLQSHYAVHYLSPNTGRTLDWNFVVEGIAREMKMNGKLTVNESDAYVQCALQGFGMVQAPLYMVMPHIEEGRLVEVLSQWKPAPLPISVLYQHNRHLSPKVRAFVDWVAELFATCPLHKACTMGMPEVAGECRFTAERVPAMARDLVEKSNIAEGIL
jgi:LysR family transcriptional regulator for bpeEF and oprC